MGASWRRRGESANEAYLVLSGRVRCFVDDRLIRGGSLNGVDEEDCEDDLEDLDEALLGESCAASRCSGWAVPSEEGDERSSFDVSRGGVLVLREILRRKARHRCDAFAARDTELVALPRAALELLPKASMAQLLRRELRKANATNARPRCQAGKVTLASVSATTVCVLPANEKCCGLAKCVAESLAHGLDQLERRRGALPTADAFQSTSSPVSVVVNVAQLVKHCSIEDVRGRLAAHCAHRQRSRSL